MKWLPWNIIGNWLNKRDENAPHFLAEFQPAAQAVEDIPASPAGRTFALTLCAIFSFAILWAFLGHLDIVASARGRLVAVGQVKVIQASEQGVVSAIKVEEGQLVKQGDVLVELDMTDPEADFERINFEYLSSKVRAQLVTDLLEQPELTYLAKNVQSTDFDEDVPEQIIQLQVKTIQSMIAEHAEGVRRLQEEANSQFSNTEAARKAVKRLEETVPLVEDRYNRVKELSEKDLISKISALQAEEEYIEARESYAGAKESLMSEESRLKSLDSELARTRAAFRRRMVETLSEAQSAVSNLGQQLNKADRRMELSTLRAPIDGYVQQIRVSTVGGIVSPAETLMVVVPENADVEAEVFLQNKDIGFVYEGQEVELKLDTFKFTKYGLLNGTVRALSRNAVLSDQLATMPSQNQIDQQALFSARIDLKQKEMEIDGKIVRLTPGMAVTAEVKTGQRRVIEYLLSPLIQYADESLRER